MFFDAEKLISMVYELLESVADHKKYRLEVRAEMRLKPDASLWIPALDGATAYRLGEKSESEAVRWRMMQDMCDMLDIDMERLIAAVKSMRRKECHNGRWDNPDLTYRMCKDDKDRLIRFLRDV